MYYVNPLIPRQGGETPPSGTVPGADCPGAGRPLYRPPGSPAYLDQHEKIKYRAAALKVQRLYPGPVGELLSREIHSWLEFGFRFGSSALMKRLVEHIHTAPLPTPTPPPRISPTTSLTQKKQEQEQST